MIYSGKSKIGIVLVLLFFSNFTYGQKDSTKTKFSLWFNIGAHGALSTHSTFVAGPQLGVNLLINQKHYFKVNSYYSAAKHYFVSASDYGPDRFQWIKNISFQYGIIKFNSKSSILTLSAGVSYGNAKYRTNVLATTSATGWLTHDVYLYDQHIYWGIPIDLTILSTGQHHGFSIDFYTNIHKYADYGIRINYNVGKIISKDDQRKKLNTFY